MIWVDAQLSPALAKWITVEVGQAAQSVRDLGLRHAKDKDIYAAARQANAIVMTKDADFADLVERLGPPPHVIWLTCGNTSNASLRVLIKTALYRHIGGDFIAGTDRAEFRLDWSK